MDMLPSFCRFYKPSLMIRQLPRKQLWSWEGSRKHAHPGWVTLLGSGFVDYSSNYIKPREKE